MAQGVLAFAVALAVNYGTSKLEQALTKKPKLAPLDRGRLDDVRIQTSELGGILPIVKGKVRLAGNIIDSTPVQVRTVTTPGRSGGKGLGGRPQEAPSTTYSYHTSLDIAICAALKSTSPGITRVWFNSDLVLNADATGSAGGGDDRQVDITGVQATGSYPADLDEPSVYYNAALAYDGNGEATGFLTARGCNFRFYKGLETQTQCDVFVALHGAAATPAYRGVCHAVFSIYTIPNGVLENISFEVDEGTTDLADVVTDLYQLAGLDTASYLDVSALAGKVLPGLIIPARTRLGDLLAPLEQIFAFDLVDRDGKIVAVTRGGSVAATIVEGELSAHEFGTERPRGPVVTTFVNAEEIPRVVEVNHLDPALDYHANTQPGARTIVVGQEPAQINVPGVLSADAAQQAALRIVYALQLESKRKEFALGPKYLYLAPADVVDLVTTQATQRVRITQQQQQLVGLGKYRSVPERAAVYTQTQPGSSGDGYEPPIGEFPANSFLVFADVPPLRLEDDTLGYYVGACQRGTGAWRGAVLYKEEIEDEFTRITGFERQATAGVVQTGVSFPGGDITQFDRTSQLVVDLHFDGGELISRPESELLMRPVNVAYYDGAIIQWADAEALTPVAPYVARYRLSNLLWGLNGTEAKTTHGANGRFLVFNDAVKFRHEDANEIGVARDFKGVTVGQALANAPVSSFTFQAAALRSLSPVHATVQRDSTGNALIEWVRRNRLTRGLRDGAGIMLGEEEELYDLELFDGAGTLKRTWTDLRPRKAEPVLWQRGGNLARLTVGTDNAVSLTAAHLIRPGCLALFAANLRQRNAVRVPRPGRRAHLPLRGLCCGRPSDERAAAAEDPVLLQS